MSQTKLRVQLSKIVIDAEILVIPDALKMLEDEFKVKIAFKAESGKVESKITSNNSLMVV